MSSTNSRNHTLYSLFSRTSYQLARTRRLQGYKLSIQTISNKEGNIYWSVYYSFHFKSCTARPRNIRHHQSYLQSLSVDLPHFLSRWVSSLKQRYRHTFLLVYHIPVPYNPRGNRPSSLPATVCTNVLGICVTRLSYPGPINYDQSERLPGIHCDQPCIQNHMKQEDRQLLKRQSKSDEKSMPGTQRT